MALTLLDQGNDVIDDAGGEQDLVPITLTAGDSALVLTVDIEDLVAAEVAIVRAYSQIAGGGTNVIQETTLTAGTDPDNFMTDVIVVADARFYRFSIEPSGWAADRTISWTSFKL